jgi:hypothetical protein
MPSPTVKIGGKEYSLRLTTKAVMLTEDELDKPITEIFSPDAQPRVREVVTLVWACLHKENPELTIDDIAEQIDFVKFGDVASAISGALSEGDEPTPLAAQSK